jgi:murein DD-endopeptidase MepM/ murein hydrolase activator NlpD
MVNETAGGSLSTMARIAGAVRQTSRTDGTAIDDGGNFLNMTLQDKLRRIKARMFPERQILVRSDGKVRFVNLSGNVQIIASMVAVVFVGLIANASYEYALHDELIDQRDAKIARMADNYDILSTNLDAIHNRYETITKDLENKQQFLKDLLIQRTSLSERLDKLHTELENTSSQRDQARVSNEKLHRRAGTLGRQLDDALTTANRLESNLRYLGVELSDTMSARDNAQTQRSQLSESVQRLQLELSAARKTKSRLTDALRQSLRRMDSVTVERDHANDRNLLLTDEAKQLERRMVMLEESQSQLVSRIHARTESNIDDLESAVSLTGINVAVLLKRMRAASEKAMGGPMVELAPKGMNQELSEDLIGLENRLSRWSALNGVLEILPVIPPVEQYSISSRFGTRRDPFTKKRAFHAGMDFAAPNKSRIYSTAAGTVSFVGWDGAYGRLVEIDHGLGIKTRYGHLRKILVKKGQKVKFRQKIALMGSSGRSTGSHVHYEIKFDRKQINPASFIKAGKYVFKLRDTRTR